MSTERHIALQVESISPQLLRLQGFMRDVFGRPYAIETLRMPGTPKLRKFKSEVVESYTRLPVDDRPKLQRMLAWGAFNPNSRWPLERREAAHTVLTTLRDADWASIPLPPSARGAHVRSIAESDKPVQEKVVALLYLGLKASAIAKVLRKKNEVVDLYLKYLKKKGIAPAPAEVKEYQISKVKALLDEGYTPEQCARMLGKDLRTVRRIAKSKDKPSKSGISDKEVKNIVEGKDRKIYKVQKLVEAGLDDMQIASLLQLTPESVRVYRFRLRTKGYLPPIESEKSRLLPALIALREQNVPYAICSERLGRPVTVLMSWMYSYRKQQQSA
jgi:hypothetical protein